MKIEVASHSRQDVLNALIWLNEAGIDTVVSDQPRAWLQQQAVSPQEADFPAENTENIKKSEGFSATEASDRPSPLLVEGQAGASVVLVLDADPSAGGKTILAGNEALLLSRMMAAIGLDIDEVIRLGLSGPSQTGHLHNRIGMDGLRTLLLLGDGPARAFLGKPAAKARGAVHSIDINGAQIATVVTLAPHLLIQQPRMKALAWDDLRLFARLVRQ